MQWIWRCASTGEAGPRGRLLGRSFTRDRCLAQGSGEVCVWRGGAGDTRRRAGEPRFEQHSVPGMVTNTIRSTSSLTFLGGRGHGAHLRGVETEALTNRPQNQAGWVLNLF